MAERNQEQGKLAVPSFAGIMKNTKEPRPMEQKSRHSGRDTGAIWKPDISLGSSAASRTPADAAVAEKSSNGGRKKRYKKE